MSVIKRYGLIRGSHGGRMSDDQDTLSIDAKPFVLHTDHLASHAYDEAVEREAFEAAMLEEGFRTTLEPDLDGVYMSPTAHAMWCGWLRCAKSRAKRAGGDV